MKSKNRKTYQISKKKFYSVMLLTLFSLVLFGKIILIDNENLTSINEQSESIISSEMIDKIETDIIRDDIIDDEIEGYDLFNYDNSNKNGVTLLKATTKTIEMSVSNPALEEEAVIYPNGTVFQRLSLEGGGNQAEVGSPSMPYKTIKVLIPEGKTVDNVNVFHKEIETLKGTYCIEPAQYPAIMGSNDLPKIAFNKTSYTSSDMYPNYKCSEEGTYWFKGYKIFVLNLYPIQYIPSEGKVLFYQDMTVQVNLKDSSETNSLFRGTYTDKKSVADLVDTPQLVETYGKEPFTETKPKSSATSLTVLYPGPYDLVIITNEALNNSKGEYTFQDLALRKDMAGIKTIIITVEEIYENYDGIDEQTKIRNFIKDAYLNWGIEYVLLGGDCDSDSQNRIIPYRGLYAEIFTIGGSYRERIPSDLYYAALDGDWDADGDGTYGEEEEYSIADEADFFAEVYIGRAPVDTEEELSNFIRKTLNHEDQQNSKDPYLYNALMAGEDLQAYYGMLIYVWGGDYMDELIEGCDSYGHTTTGIPESYFIEKLYERDINPNWGSSHLIAKIEEEIHILNHDGHANSDSVMHMGASSINSLENEKYFFGYSQGCDAAAFDSSDSVIEHFVKGSNGAFAFIGNSRYGFLNWGSTDGASQHFNREFYDAIFKEGIEEIGRANQDSKHDCIGDLDRASIRWCYYTINLLGDPTATLNAPALEHDLDVSLDGPERPEINVNNEIKATIKNRGQFIETNVNFSLFLDGTCVESLFIESLPVGQTRTINYLWNAIDYGVYNVTAVVKPLSDENQVRNNVFTELVEISHHYLRVGMVYSHGETRLIRITDPFEREGYKRYNIYSEITEDLINYFRIIFIGDWGDDWSASEITALENFIINGGVVVGIDGYNQANAIKIIAEKYGIVLTGESGDAITGRTTNIDKLHPLMKNIDYIFLKSVWNARLLVSSPAKAIINDTSNRGVFGAAVNIGEGKFLVLTDQYERYYSSNREFLKNILTWQPKIHDVEATIEVPLELDLNGQYMINATVSNVGRNNETNIAFSLSLDGEKVMSLYIEKLNVGESSTIKYPWSPTDSVMYNFSAFVEPIAEELYISNNLAFEYANCIRIGYIHKHEDNSFYCASVFEDLRYQIDELTSTITEDLLNKYKCIFLDESGSEWSSSELSALENYIENGGTFVILKADIPSEGPYKIAAKHGIVFRGDYSSGFLYTINLENTHPLMKDIGELSFNNEPRETLSIDKHGIPLAWDGDTGKELIASVDIDKGHLLVLGGELSLYYGKRFLSNILKWDLLEHDVSAYIDTPITFEINENCQTNITITNKGTNNEQNLNLTLCVNGNLVYSQSNFDLLTGQTAVFSYDWTPIEYCEYIFELFVTPVEGESLLVNNIDKEPTKVTRNYTMFEVPCKWYDAYTNGDKLENSYYLYGTVDLPFEFEFYEKLFNKVYVSKYGYISFEDSAPSNLYEPDFPSAEDPYVIAPFWESLSSNGEVYVWSTAEFVAIEYYDFNHYYSSSYGNRKAGTFEVVLFANGDVLLLYKSIENDYGATIGLNLGIDTRYFNSYELDLDDKEYYGLMFTHRSEPPEFEFQDVRATLEFPGYVQPNELSTVNATFTNLGTEEVSYLAHELYLNGLLVDSGTIQSIESGENLTYTYQFILPEFNIHNLTIIISSVSGETHLANNIDTILLYPHYNMFEVPCSWYDAYTNGDLLSLSGSSTKYGTVDLPFSFEFYNRSFSKVYVGSRGYLSFVDYSPISTEYNIPCPERDDFQYLIAPFWESLNSNGEIYVWSTSEFIAIEYYDFDHYYSSYGKAGTFEVVLFANGDILFLYKSIENDYGASIGLNFGIDTRYFNSYELDLDDKEYYGLMFTHRSEPPEFEFQDIRATLEFPGYVQPNELSTINATFTNLGTEEVSNLIHELYLNGILVDSGTIQSIGMGENLTYTYQFILPEFNVHDLTVIISSVSGETHLANNIDTILLYPHYNMFEVPCSWYDAYTNGDLLSLSGSYTKYGTVDLPFSFEFYNRSFSEVYISSRGYLSFVDSTPTNSKNEIPCPNRYDLQYLIAPFWEDHLDQYGEIYVWSTAEFVVIEYHDINYQYSSYKAGTFEVVLFANGDILFLYQSIEKNPWDYVATVGLNLGIDSRYFNTYELGMDEINYFGLCFTHESTPPTIEFQDLWVHWENDNRVQVNEEYTINATIENVGVSACENIYYTIYINKTLRTSGFFEKIEAGQKKEINFVWFALEYNNFLFEINCSISAGEMFYINNYDQILIKSTDITPPTIEFISTDFVYEYDASGNNISWIATDDNPGNYYLDILYLETNEWILNGEGISWTSGEIVVIFLDNFLVGDYLCYFYVNDDFGNYYGETIEITVEDTTDPTWDPTPTDQSVEFGSPFSYDVNALDAYDIDYYWISDDFNFTIGGNGLITAAPALSVGVYALEVRAYDIFGNNCSAVFKVTVEDKVNPPPIPPDDDDGDDDDDDDGDDINIPGYDIPLIIGVIGLVAVILVKKRLKNNKN